MRIKLLQAVSIQYEKEKPGFQLATVEGQETNRVDGKASPSWAIFLRGGGVTVRARKEVIWSLPGKNC